MHSDDALHEYYERDRERDRLASGLGELEFLRTVEIVSRTLPPAPAVIADIGGGPGRYTDWLHQLGHTVIHRDLVPHHVDQVRHRYGTNIDSAIGDACDVGDIPDESVDAVLLLGPLYHLPEPAARVQAIREAARITRPGGMVYSAAITRWSARIHVILVDRFYHERPEFLTSMDAVDETGLLVPQSAGEFTGYAHTPDQFRGEMAIDELDLEAILAVEGIVSAFTDDEVTARLAEPTDRAAMLDSLRALEAVPDLLGASAHLLAVSRRVIESA